MSARRHHPTRGFSTLPALSKCARFKNSGGTSEAGTRGTRIHATIEQSLGHEAPDAFTLEEVKAEAGLHDELAWISEQIGILYPGDEPLEVEVEVPILDANFQEVTFGTIDYYRLGHVSDLKTGQFKDYKAQMAAQSLALMDRDGLDTMTASLIWSKFQRVDTWTWSREEVENIVWSIIEAQERQDAAQPNENCTYCKDGETCPARVNAAYTLPVALTTSENILSYAEKLTAEERGDFLRKLKVAKKWCEEAERAMSSWGLANPETNLIAGFKVGTTKPNRKWIDQNEAMKALKAKAIEMKRPFEGLVEIELAGVTRVHEVLGRSKPVKELVDSLLFQPEGVPALMEDWTASKKNVEVTA